MPIYLFYAGLSPTTGHHFILSVLYSELDTWMSLRGAVVSHSLALSNGFF